MNMETVKFGVNGEYLLAPYEDVTTYATGLELSELTLFTSFDLIWFKNEGETVGYAIVGKMTKEMLRGTDDSEDVLEAVEDGKEYLYIPYFEIFSTHQDKGIGKMALDKLKEKFAGETVLVYTTNDSYDFWEDNGFETVNLSSWWFKMTA